MSKKLSNNVFKKKSGIQNIQEYLETGRSLTALEALSNFGIFRLASAIEVLRKRGMSIETEMKEDPNGKTYARYTLVVPVEAAGEPEVQAEDGLPEINVGDRVRVTSYVNEEDSVFGKEGTVRRTDGCMWPFNVQLDGKDFEDLFYRNELTLLPAEAPKKELKVGARVRVLQAYPSEQEHGDTGVITHVFRSVEFPYQAKLDTRSGAYLFTADELEVL